MFTVANGVLLVTCSARKVCRTHVSQQLKFQGILEFVDCQFPRVIHDQPQHAYLVDRVFLGCIETTNISLSVLTPIFQVNLG